VNQLHTVEGLAGVESIWNPGDSQNAWLDGVKYAGRRPFPIEPFTRDGVSEFELSKNYFPHSSFRH
jgi:hypothetical protein